MFFKVWCWNCSKVVPLLSLTDRLCSFQTTGGHLRRDRQGCIRETWSWRRPTSHSPVFHLLFSRWLPLPNPSPDPPTPPVWDLLNGWHLNLCFGPFLFFLRATLVYSLYDWGFISLKTNTSPPYMPLKGEVAFYFTVLLYTTLYKYLIYFF